MTKSIKSRDFLDKDMSRTKVIIGYLPPLLSLEDPALEQFITELVHLLHVAHIYNNNNLI